MPTIIARASESAHWYTRTGLPQYTVKAKDGSDRATTLRDARKFELLPSVTTVMKVAAMPALEAWKQEQMLLAALTLPRVEGETEKQLIERIVHDSKETGRKAADRGTEMHEAIEKWLGGKKPDKHESIAVAYENRIYEHFELPKYPSDIARVMTWQIERSFSHELGYGGKCDAYVSPSTVAKTGIVLDTKTKEFAAGDKVPAYEEQLMQLAAYRHGLGMPKARCANVFVSALPECAGLIHIHEWTEEELQRGFEMFKCLLSYWQLKNQFNIPSEKRI